MNKIKFLWTLFMVLMMSGLVVSCDKDDIDEFTAAVVKNPWIADNGEIYDFYSSFKGVVYANSESYEKHVIDKSFVWTETDDLLTIGVDGYRDENGEMVTVEGEDMVLTTYQIKSNNEKTIVLANGSETITLNVYKNR